VVNQIELHPFLQQRDVVAACKAHDIVIECYSPIVKARKLDDPVVVSVAKTVGKTSAQVLIAYGVQKGYVSLPKTVTPERLEENADVFFKIPEEEMSKLDSLDCGLTTGWDPTKYYLPCSNTFIDGSRNHLHIFTAHCTDYSFPSRRQSNSRLLQSSHQLEQAISRRLEHSFRNIDLPNQRS
jgi:hypothetical protein